MGFHPTRLRTTIFIIFITVVIIPITVLVSQQQQNTKQRASGVDNVCSPPYEGYLGCFSFNAFPSDSVCTSSCTTTDGEEGQYCYTSTNVGKACVAESNQIGACDEQGSCIASAVEVPVPTETPAPTLIRDEEIISPTITVAPIEAPTISVSVQTSIPTNTPTNTIIQNTPTPSQISFCYLKNKGDADCDNKIAITDETIWENEFVGEISGIITQKQSDFNSDGIISIVDFNIWKTSMSDATLPH